MVINDEYLGEELGSEEKYKMLFNSIDEGFCIVEVIFDADNKPVDYRFLEVNSTFERQTGLIDAKGKLMRELRPKHEEHWFEIYGKIALTGKSIRFQNPAKELNRFYDVYAFKIGDSESRKVAILFNDITERKKAEEALRESEEKYRSLFNSMSEMFQVLELVYDDNGQVVDFYYLDVNPATERLVNMTRDQIVGKRAKEIFGTVEDYWIQALSQVNKTKEPMHINNYSAELDKYYDVNAFKVEGQNKVAILFTDITERKKAEEELKDALITLEIQVEERTDELKEAITDLKRSNEELQRFAYVSSHDLQEPLRTIASFTQLLQRRYEGKLDDDADEFMEYTVEAAKRMKEQIEGLLEYSRVGTKGEEFKQVDMNSTLNQTVGTLSRAIHESNAKITYDKLPWVMGDVGQLQRVFQNLISNAIKFRKCEEPLKIHISSYRDDDKEFVFSIKDNGIGIEEQYSERIFTIFQRLHTRDVYKGTGIGLSVVKRIIERHGGRIWVESEFGAGSTFYFTLPIRSN